MRLQDRFLELLEGEPTLDRRRYVLREIGRVVAGLDSERVVDRLEAGCRSEDAGEAYLALRSLDLFLPAHVQRCYGPPRTSLASVVTGAGNVEEELARIGEVPLRVGSFLARGAIAKVLARLGELPPRTARRALLRVGRFCVQEVDAFVESRVAARSVDPMTAHLWSRRSATTPELAPDLARDPWTVAAVHPASAAPWVALAREPAVDDWPQAAGVALEDTFAQARTGLIDLLFDARHGWGIMHALVSLSHGGEASDLPVILKAYRKFDQTALRAEVARCLGRLRVPEARQVCQRIVERDPSSAEAAAALESLTRQPLSEDERRAIFTGALESTNPDVLVHAALGMAGVDPERAAAVVRELVSSGSDEGRLHGAHILGYLPGGSSSRLLGRLVREDDCPAIRRQALASLAYHPPSSGLLGELVALLPFVEPDLLVFAVRAVIRAAEEVEQEVVDAVFAAFDSSRGEQRRALFTAVGALGVGQSRERVAVALDGSRTGDDVPGALEACAASGRRWRDAGARRWLEAPAPAVAAAASLAMLQDDIEAAFATIDRLVSGDPASLEEGTAALETAGLILDQCLAHPRYRDTITQVKEIAKRPEYQEFAASRLSVDRTRVERMRAGARDVAPHLGDLAVTDLAMRMLRGVEEAPGTGRKLRTRALRFELLDEPLAPESTIGPFWIGLAVLATALFMVPLFVTPSTMVAARIEEPRAPSGRLTVETASPGARANGHPLAAGGQLAVPVRVEAPGGPVVLGFPPCATRIRLERGAAVRLAQIEAVRGRPGVQVFARDPEGDIVFELPEPHSHVQVELGPGLIRCPSGRYRLSCQGGRRTVLAEQGKAIVRDDRGRTTVVPAGRRATVEGGSVTERDPAPSPSASGR